MNLLELRTNRILVCVRYTAA